MKLSGKYVLTKEECAAKDTKRYTFMASARRILDFARLEASRMSGTFRVSIDDMRSALKHVCKQAGVHYRCRPIKDGFRIDISRDRETVVFYVKYN